MSLTAADIAEILRLVEGSSFDELSLEFQGLKLNFKRSIGGMNRSEQLAEPAQPKASPAIASAATVQREPPPCITVAAEENLHNVPAPLLGTFYRASKPGAPPFVAIGSPVQEDTIVGIIEVMKLMNTVRAQVRGTVADILAADGALVEYGEVLLRVHKAV